MNNIAQFAEAKKGALKGYWDKLHENLAGKLSNKIGDEATIYNYVNNKEILFDAETKWLKFVIGISSGMLAIDGSVANNFHLLGVALTVEAGAALLGWYSAQYGAKHVSDKFLEKKFPTGKTVPVMFSPSEMSVPETYNYVKNTIAEMRKSEYIINLSKNEGVIGRYLDFEKNSQNLADEKRMIMINNFIRINPKVKRISDTLKAQMDALLKKANDVMGCLMNIPDSDLKNKQLKELSKIFQNVLPFSDLMPKNNGETYRNDITNIQSTIQDVVLKTHNQKSVRP